MHIYNRILLIQKRNKALIHVSMPKNLNNTVLNDKSETQKVTYYKILFILKIQKWHIHRDRLQIGGCQGLSNEENGK